MKKSLILILLFVVTIAIVSTVYIQNQYTVVELLEEDRENGIVSVIYEEPDGHAFKITQSSVPMKYVEVTGDKNYAKILTRHLKSTEIEPTVIDYSLTSVYTQN